MMEKKLRFGLFVLSVVSIVVATLVFLNVIAQEFFYLVTSLLLLMVSIWYYSYQNKGISGILMMTVCTLMVLIQVVSVFRYMFYAA